MKKTNKIILLLCFALHVTHVTPHTRTLQITHAVLKTVHCTAAMYATLAKSKKRANIARFVETLTEMPCYILKKPKCTIPFKTYIKTPKQDHMSLYTHIKELDISYCSLAPLCLQVCSDIIKHIKEYKVISKNRSNAKNLSEEAFAKLMQKHYYGTTKNMYKQKICQCILILVDYTTSIITSLLHINPSDKPRTIAAKEFNYVTNELTNISAKLIRRFFFKNNTFKTQGIHNMLDTLLPLSHYLIDITVEPGKHFAFEFTKFEMALNLKSPTSKFRAYV